MDRYKAQLVVKGCSQKPGTDFKETFAPVARFDSIQILLSIAATNDCEIRQLDVKTAFLYGHFNEKIFMKHPEGFDDGSGRVCRLNKSLYGLNQAPKQWHIKIDKFMKGFGLFPTTVDPCIYSVKHGTLMVALYVDDGLIIDQSKSNIDELLTEM